MRQLGLSEQSVMNGVLRYTLEMDRLTNDYYSSMSARAALYLHSLVLESYHQLRQETVIQFLKTCGRERLSVVDIGFGVPSKYVTETLSLQKNWRVTLADRDQEALDFAEAVVACAAPTVRPRVSLLRFDMDSAQYVGNFDVFIFMDSIEHAADPTMVLGTTVSAAPTDSFFILSLPICKNPTPMHFIEFLDDEAAIKWLESSGLTVVDSVAAVPNPEVDYFASLIDGGFRNLVVLCCKVRT
jgi:2-polyprenyl-3-methyl-5-hydroxy-6-metoxy-1,4-benzoquinol methylase